MSSVPNTNPTPPGVPVLHVIAARTYLDDAPSPAAVPADDLATELATAITLMAGLLEAYDVASARLSWLAAEHAQCQDGGVA